MASLSLWDRSSALSLFERIRGEHAELPSEHEVGALVGSVKRNLARVLNTRTGGCRSAPDLGVEDLNDATQGSADINGSIREAIRQCICEYEPRIVQADVTAIDSKATPLEMTFRVTVHVRLDALTQVASFDIHVDGNRHYRMM